MPRAPFHISILIHITLNLSAILRPYPLPCISYSPAESPLTLQLLFLSIFAGTPELGLTLLPPFSTTRVFGSLLFSPPFVKELSARRRHIVIFASLVEDEV
jgi:hypothetical protein